MKAIWKFPIEITDVQTVSMPEGARVLSAQAQGDTLCLWAAVDTKALMRDVEVCVFGTGHTADEAGYMEFVDTVQMRGGALVWHVFYDLKGS